MDAATLAAIMRQAPSVAGRFEACFGSVGEALAAARAAAAPDDRIIVFGSFVTVADAMRELKRGSNPG
jgi:dihydrofolate synthase/folylpolyglutamate synthase